MSGIRVTTVDLDHPEDSQTGEIMDDYVIVTAGSCYVASVVQYANGTAVLTVKGAKPCRTYQGDGS